MIEEVEEGRRREDERERRKGRRREEREGNTNRQREQMRERKKRGMCGWNIYMCVCVYVCLNVYMCVCHIHTNRMRKKKQIINVTRKEMVVFVKVNKKQVICFLTSYPSISFF